MTFATRPLVVLALLVAPALAKKKVTPTAPPLPAAVAKVAPLLVARGYAAEPRDGRAVAPYVFTKTLDSGAGFFVRVYAADATAELARQFSMGAVWCPGQATTLEDTAGSAGKELRALFPVLTGEPLPATLVTDLDSSLTTKTYAVKNVHSARLTIGDMYCDKTGGRSLTVDVFP